MPFSASEPWTIHIIARQLELDMDFLVVASLASLLGGPDHKQTFSRAGFANPETLAYRCRAGCVRPLLI